MAMTAIDRTAYPCFKRTFSARELSEIYTPTSDERWFAQTTARTQRLQFNLLVLLKCFQRLGYFPALETIPAVLVTHIRSCLGLTPDEAPLGYETPRTLYRHHELIRDHLDVHPYSLSAVNLRARCRRARWRGTNPSVHQRLVGVPSSGPRHREESAVTRWRIALHAPITRSPIERRYLCGVSHTGDDPFPLGISCAAAIDRSAQWCWQTTSTPLVGLSVRWEGGRAHLAKHGCQVARGVTEILL
jgi:hypothetical protein